MSQGIYPDSFFIPPPSETAAGACVEYQCQRERDALSARCGTLITEYLNHAYGQLDEQSKPMLRGAWKCSARLTGIPLRNDLPGSSDAAGEGGNRQQQTCIAKLYASKGTDLPGARIDDRCAGITLADLRIRPAEDKQGWPIMRCALNRRNPGITEEDGSSSRTASREGTDF